MVFPIQYFRKIGASEEQAALYDSVFDGSAHLDGEFVDKCVDFGIDLDWAARSVLRGAPLERYVRVYLQSRSHFLDSVSMIGWMKLADAHSFEVKRKELLREFLRTVGLIFVASIRSMGSVPVSRSATVIGSSGGLGPMRTMEMTADLFSFFEASVSGFCVIRPPGDDWVRGTKTSGLELSSYPGRKVTPWIPTIHPSMKKFSDEVLPLWHFAGLRPRSWIRAAYGTLGASGPLNDWFILCNVQTKVIVPGFSPGSVIQAPLEGGLSDMVSVDRTFIRRRTYGAEVTHDGAVELFGLSSG
jgi:hypothetical protein